MLTKRIKKKLCRLFQISVADSGRYSRQPKFRPSFERLEDRLVPATIVVNTFADVVNPNDHVISLREAISMANATAEQDTIQLRSGVYKISRIGGGATNALGDFDITQSLTIIGKGTVGGKPAAATVIEGSSNLNTRDRLFEVFGKINVTFANLSLRNGGNALLNGGAIKSPAANITLQNVIATDNRALDGGAIHTGAGSLTLVNSALGNNKAARSGGGIFSVSAIVTLNNSKVKSNSAGSHGGGIFSQLGNVALLHSSVINNTSNGEGAGINTFNTATLTDSTVSGNQAKSAGGGIRAETMFLVNSTLSGNSAEAGGGFAGAIATITSSTIRQNISRTKGGGIAAGDVTISNSTVNGNQAGTGGGGITTGLLTLTNSTVAGNRAGTDGGGIRAFRVDLTNASISGNTAGVSGGGHGGGIFTHNAVIQDSGLTGNTAFGDGGGLFSDGNDVVRVVNSRVHGNTATKGGGLLSKNSLVVDRSTVRDNVAHNLGGGIFQDGFGDVSVFNSTISGNEAEAGGGLFAAKANVQSSTVHNNTAIASGGGIHATFLNMVNVTVSINSALTGGGGGIAALQGSILNSTITNNLAAGTEGQNASAGGGILSQPSIGFTPLHIKNTIIANNHLAQTTSRVGQDVSGTFISDGHNLVGVVDGGSGFGLPVLTTSSSAFKFVPTAPNNGDLLGTASNPLDPKLGALADNGGLTLTHALLAGSPAIDAGDNFDAPSADQRGNNRPRDGDGNGSLIVDIGAFEL